MKASIDFKSTEDLTSLLNDESVIELLEWAQEGWTPGINTIHDLSSELSLDVEFKQDIAPAVQGLFFDIGLVCSDVPEHWFNPQPINQGMFNNSESIEDLTPIQIGINVAGLVSHASVVERGAAIAVLVTYLEEKLKRPVILKQFYSIEASDRSFMGSMVLKQENEVLDINILSFWLCCPQFINCWNRILEDMPCTRELTNINTNCTLQTNTQYGKNGMDIFVSVDKETQEWTREDSKNWIHSTLRAFGI